MQIRTLWEAPVDDNELPWLVMACDEYTIDEHGGKLPEFYSKEMKDGRRELVINVPESAVRKLFVAPVVNAEVITKVKP